MTGVAIPAGPGYARTAAAQLRARQRLVSAPVSVSGRGAGAGVAAGASAARRRVFNYATGAAAEKGKESSDE